MSEHECPICLDPFKVDDLCATDIELGICHFACLAGSPVATRGEIIEAVRYDRIGQAGGTGHGSTYDRLHTFLYDRDRAISGDAYSADEMDESVREILRIAAGGEGTEAVAMARKALRCLRLEVPACIADDVSARVERAFEALAHPARSSDTKEPR